MDKFWVILLITTPFVTGAGLGIHEFALRMTGSQKAFRKVHQWVMLAALTASAAGAVALLFSPDAHPDFALYWIPAAGKMHLHLGQSGLFAALLTTAAAFTLCIIHGTPSPVTGSLLLIAAGSANLAFISGHFVSRYVALEIVGLCIALLPLAEVKGSDGGNLSRRVYLMLRLGDAGFLVAILLLMRYTGTLEIITALEKATSAPTIALQWIVSGLILAVWVKMGIWPFQNWLMTGKRLSPAANAWGYRLLMPNLGLYLLYRIQPLLAVNGHPDRLLSSAGLVAACFAGWLAASRTELRDNTTYLSAMQGGLIVSLAARARLDFLPCLFAFNLLALALFWIGTPRERRTTTGMIALTGAGILAFCLYIVLRMVDSLASGEKLMAVLVLFFSLMWTLRAVRNRNPNPLTNPVLNVQPTGSIPISHQNSVQHPVEKRHWIQQLIKQDALEVLLVGTVSSVMGIGRWLYQVFERDFLEQILRWITEITLGSGRWLYAVVENASLEGLLQWISRTVRMMSRQLQKVHTGKLRANLLWVVGSIVLILLTVIL